jgi:hypothetical protein
LFPFDFYLHESQNLSLETMITYVCISKHFTR